MSSSSGKSMKSTCSSRYRKSVATIFDVFLEIAAPEGNSDPFVLWKYPEDFHDEKLLTPVSKFAFPCGPVPSDNEAVTLFSFVLTQEDSMYTFGFCRYTPRTNTCLCVVSGLPWTNFFYKLLDHYASVVNSNGTEEECEALLVRAYHQELPQPGETFILESSLGRNKLEFQCPDVSKLSTIRDNRNLMDYYNCIKEEHMIAVFCSLLKERRVILTGKKLGQLSHCVIAAQSLIYPLFWQHVFIPILPRQFLDYVSAPMPILVGVPSPVFEEAKRQIDFNEVVVLNIDSDIFSSPFQDALPRDVLRILKSNLHSSNHLLGDGLARSFLRAMVAILGGYRRGLYKQPDTGKLRFDIDRFSADYKSQTMRNFLNEMQSAQIFREFIEDRIFKMESSAEELYDEFEEEVRFFDANQGLNKHHRSNLVRDKGMDVITGFHERVSKLALPKMGRSRLDNIHSEDLDPRGPFVKNFDSMESPSDELSVEIGTPAEEASVTFTPKKENSRIDLLREESPDSEPQGASSKSLVDLLDLDVNLSINSTSSGTTSPLTYRHGNGLLAQPLSFHHSHSAAQLTSNPASTGIPYPAPRASPNITSRQSSPFGPVSPLVSSRSIPSSPAHLSSLQSPSTQSARAGTSNITNPPVIQHQAANGADLLIDWGSSGGNKEINLDEINFDPLANQCNTGVIAGDSSTSKSIPNRPPKPAHLRGNPIRNSTNTSPLHHSFSASAQNQSNSGILLDLFGGGGSLTSTSINSSTVPSNPSVAPGPSLPALVQSQQSPVTTSNWEKFE